MSEKIHLSFVVPGRLVPLSELPSDNNLQINITPVTETTKSSSLRLQKKHYTKHPSFFCDRGTMWNYTAVAYLYEEDDE